MTSTSTTTYRTPGTNLPTATSIGAIASLGAAGGALSIDAVRRSGTAAVSPSHAPLTKSLPITFVAAAATLIGATWGAQQLPRDVADASLLGGLVVGGVGIGVGSGIGVLTARQVKPRDLATIGDTKWRQFFGYAAPTSSIGIGAGLVLGPLVHPQNR